MKTGRTKIWKLMLVGCVFAFVAIPASVLLSRSLDWQRDYGEAEPLVGPIWNLAFCMSEFSKKHGRPPISLDEVAGQSGSRDYSALKRYTYEFTATGPTRFYLRVNERFAFSVAEDFTPRWAHVTGVLREPQEPK